MFSKPLVWFFFFFFLVGHLGTLVITLSDSHYSACVCALLAKQKLTAPE